MDVDASERLGATSDALADGEVVWSWRRDAGAKFAMKLRFARMTVAKEPVHRGDHV
jgi:hypothetical protein